MVADGDSADRIWPGCSGAGARRGPAYVSLARASRLLVLDGRLPLRTRLPGERELAEALGVSRTTATAAYAELRDEGFLASRRGRGQLDAAARRPGAAAPSRARAGDGADRPQLRRRAPRPRARCTRALAAATAELPRYLPGPGYDAAGLPVAARGDRRALHRAAASPTTPDQILVTAGALHALSLLLRVLAGPGDRVLAEHPTYPPRWTPSAPPARARCPSPLLAGGWDLDMLEATLRQAAPRLAYLIPDHQNPTGLTLPAADRERLVALARATRTPLVIDETIAELRSTAPRRRRRSPRFDPRRRDRDHDRLDEQGLLGRAADRLDPREPGADRPAGRRPRRARHRQPGARAARRRRAARATPTRSCRASAQLPARGATRWSPRCGARCPSGGSRVPAGGLCAVGRARRAAQHRAGGDRRPLRRARRRRAALRRRRRVRALRAPALRLPEPVLEEAASRLAVAWRAVSEGPPAAPSPVALVA